MIQHILLLAYRTSLSFSFLLHIYTVYIVFIGKKLIVVCCTFYRPFDCFSSVFKQLFGWVLRIRMIFVDGINLVCEVQCHPNLPSNQYSECCFEPHYLWHTHNTALACCRRLKSIRRFWIECLVLLVFDSHCVLKHNNNNNKIFYTYFKHIRNIIAK